MTYTRVVSATDGVRAPARLDKVRPPHRRSRSAWAPSSTGSYRLPRTTESRLIAELTGFRNRDAAFRLAVFLGRFWSAPARLVLAFPIDRRALADHAALDLSEARVRGALATLEAVGFLERSIPAPGSRYRATAEGLHRKPVLFRFGAGHREAFAAANARAGAARGGQGAARRAITLSAPARPPVSLPAAHIANSPKDKGPSEKEVIMGEHTSTRSHALLDPGLEAALQRLRKAIEG